ncbi:hypothetical protein HOD75_03310 [archaeon]|jgi:hypothetical protein|nr:hypothetical protein [archaeon]MBT4241902.1 hypothetical protein [archaeon]MBT4418449.1 hypothetical protein [archaeon]
MLSKKLKKTLAGILLSLAPFTPQVNAQSPNTLTEPQTPSQYAERFNHETNQEVIRRNQRLENFEELMLIDGYTHPESNSIDFATNKEKDKIEKFLLELAGNSAEETANYGWIGNIKETLGKLTKAQLKIGSSAKEDEFYSPKLREQDRKKKLEESQTSVLRLFKKFPYETNFGVKGRLNKETLIGAKAYGNIEDFLLLGTRFKKAELSCTSEKDVEFKLQKVLDYNWTAQFDAKSNFDGEFRKATLSFAKELQNPNSKFGITAGYDSELHEGKPFIGVNYILRW